MRISITRSGENCWTHSINEDVTTTELVELWRGGAFISAQPAETNSSKARSKLDGADMVMVAINLARLPIEHVLQFHFTQRYLTAAAYESKGTGLCFLAFKLSKTSKDGRHVSMVMKGVETLYAGAQAHGSVLQSFGSERLDTFLTPDGGLSVKAEKMLAKLGKETRSFSAMHYRTAGLPRSQINIDPDSVLRLMDGYEELPERLASNTPVFCPVHADHKPQALLIHEKGGAPVVVCRCCNRSYGLDRTRRYDFGFSDRVLTDLANEELAYGPVPVADRQFEIFQEKYLPPIPLRPGITCIQSGKGTGKTTQLKKVVEDCKAQKLRVLLITHRRTLASALSDKLGLTNYFGLEEETYSLQDDFVGLKWELLGDDHERTPPASPANKTLVLSSVIKSIEPTEYFSISLDSLGKLEPKKHQYDVLIIDECEQVFAHLIGRTLRERRTSVYTRLQHYLKVAKSVFLLDADLNMITLDTLFNVGIRPETPVQFMINKPLRQVGVTYLYESRSQLTDRLMQAVVAGEKCFVASNSINEVKRLAEAAKNAKSDARIISIDANNSHSPEILKLIENLPWEFEHNIDLLIVSPALGTGVDISFLDAQGNPRTVVHKVFGIFLRNITTHFDLDQAIMRVRQPGEVHVWVDPWLHFYECEPAVLKETLEKCVLDAHRNMGFEDDGEPILSPENGLVEIWARVDAAKRGSINELAELYKRLRKSNGHQIEVVPLDEDAGKSGASMMKSAREKLRAEHVAALLDSELIASHEARWLADQDQNGVSLTEEERIQLERYRLEKFHCDVIGADLIEFDDDGRVRSKVRNFECLTEPSERLLKRDTEESKLLLPFDRRMLLLRRKLLSTLLGATALFNKETGEFSTSATVEQQTLDEFARLSIMYRKRVQLIFGLVIRRDVKAKPAIQLRETLNLIGLGLAEGAIEQVAGRKIRHYQLDSKRLDSILAVVARREEERQRWEDDSGADKSQDKVITKQKTDLSGSVVKTHETDACESNRRKLQEYAERKSKHQSELIATAEVKAVKQPMEKAATEPPPMTVMHGANDEESVHARVHRIVEESRRKRAQPIASLA